MTADKQLPTYKDKQRKYKLVLISMGALCLGLVGVIFSPALASIYSTFTTAIIGLNLAYGGANIGNKWVTGKKKDDSNNR